MTENSKLAIADIKAEHKDKIGHFDMLFVKPLDETLLHRICQKYKSIITVEDGIIKGGFGSAVLEFATENDYHLKIKCLGVPDKFIEHGSVDELQEMCGINVENIREVILSQL